MPTQLANDNHRMIIVTDNPTTRLDYDKLLQSSSQPHSSPVLGLAEPDWIVQNEQESKTPPFHFDFAFTAAEGIEKIKAHQRARELLDVVGLDSKAFDRFPHEFSGGQRQRIGIARALALDPDILVADEPVSALDVSIQAQILDLLDQIRKEMDLSMLFITHDLRVAAQVCDFVAVMQKGLVVEVGATNKLFTQPQHEYTKSLLDAVPGKDWHFA